MKKLLALAFLIAAVSGAPTPSLAFNGMQGGNGHGGGFQHHGGGFHGNPGLHPFHGFGGFGAFPARHAFVARRGFVFVGVPFPVTVNAVGYAGTWPVYLYCQNPEGFFPDVQACPTGWLQVSQ